MAGCGSRETRAAANGRRREPHGAWSAAGERSARRTLRLLRKPGVAPRKNPSVDDAKTMMLDTSALALRTSHYPRPVAAASDPDVPLLSDDARVWISRLRGPAGARDLALAELHALLLRAARFELGRRRGQLGHVIASDVDDLATQAADDALMAILGKLESFRGASRFTTWAYKFALLEAGVKARRRRGTDARSPSTARPGRTSQTPAPRRTSGSRTASCWARCATPSGRL